MDPNEAVARIGASLEIAGYEPEQELLGDRQVLVGRISMFRWRWFATRLHTFVAVAAFPPLGTHREALDDYLHRCTELAIARKGGLPRGLQTGVAIVAVAVTSGADDSLRDWATKVHGRQFAAIPFPVVADTAARTVTRPQRMMIGAIYAGHLRRVVDAHVTAALSI
jgi:hypothetical protein